jgi:hypothetical protein
LRDKTGDSQVVDRGNESGNVDLSQMVVHLWILALAWAVLMIYKS